MGSKRRQENHECLKSLPVDSAFLPGQLNQLIVVLHETGNHGVETELVEAVFNVIYQLVAQLYHFLGRLHILVPVVHYQVPETVQETGYALNAPVIPLCIQLRRSHKQLIKTQGVTAVVSHQIIGRHHVALGFTHLDAVLSCNHALVEQLLERLVKINGADIAQELGVET